MNTFILMMVMCSSPATLNEECTAYEIDYNLSQSDCELYITTDSGIDQLKPLIATVKDENYSPSDVIEIRYLTCEQED